MVKRRKRSVNKVSHENAAVTLSGVQIRSQAVKDMAFLQVNEGTDWGLRRQTPAGSPPQTLLGLRPKSRSAVGLWAEAPAGGGLGFSFNFT